MVACISHIILYMLHQTKNPSFTKQRNCRHKKMLELILCLPFTLLLPYNLAHNVFDIRWGLGGTREDFANHLCITLWYNSHLQPYSRLLCNHHQSSPIPRHISHTNIICTLNFNVQKYNSWSLGSLNPTHTMWKCFTFSHIG